LWLVLIGIIACRLSVFRSGEGSIDALAAIVGVEMAEILLNQKPVIDDVFGQTRLKGDGCLVDWQ
jgi:hypothetical protein